MEMTPPLTRFHPEIAHPADKLPTDASCVELAASMPQILFTNLATASCALGALHRYLSTGEPHAEVAFDTLDAVMRPVPLPI